MLGDILAWIFAAVSVIVLIAAERTRRRRREKYRRDLILEFSKEDIRDIEDAED